MLGFAFRDDVRHLQPLARRLPRRAFDGVVDLQKLAQTRLKLTRPPSLSEVAAALLRRPICKRNQRSNWERRPLRPDQLEYAAIDALVLLELHELLVGSADNGLAQ